MNCLNISSTWRIHTIVLRLWIYTPSIVGIDNSFIIFKQCLLGSIQSTRTFSSFGVFSINWVRIVLFIPSYQLVHWLKVLIVKVKSFVLYFNKFSDEFVRRGEVPKNSMLRVQRKNGKVVSDNSRSRLFLSFNKLFKVIKILSVAKLRVIHKVSNFIDNFFDKSIIDFLKGAKVIISNS